MKFYRYSELNRGKPKVYQNNLLNKQGKHNYIYSKKALILQRNTNIVTRINKSESPTSITLGVEK